MYFTTLSETDSQIGRGKTIPDTECSSFRRAPRETDELSEVHHPLTGIGGAQHPPDPETVTRPRNAESGCCWCRSWLARAKRRHLHASTPSHLVFHETKLTFDTRIVTVPSNGVYVGSRLFGRVLKLTCRVPARKRAFRSPRACWSYRFVVTLSNLRCHPAPVYLPGTADGGHAFTSLWEEGANAENSSRSRRYSVPHTPK